MIQGVITSRHVLLHAPTIVKGFGLRVLLHCIVALLARHPTTFLGIVSQLD